MQSIKIRNKIITAQTLDQIHQSIQDNWERGRSYISYVLCEQWDWRQANGHLKEMACRELLLRLERMNLIVLPPRICSKNNRIKKQSIPSTLILKPVTGRIDAFKRIDFELADTTAKRRYWNSLIDRYHYLGCKHIVGSCLKYLVYLDGQIVCLFGWGSAAWKVGCRDKFIGWSHEQRSQRLNSIANNIRFLILPWIRVQHFASKVLAASVGLIAKDWQEHFQEDLLLLETFVDRSRFSGTCYKAANWLYLGDTKGSGKSGARYHHHGIIKSVFVYPVRHDFRRKLCS
ncbi:MAG: DUF4338 domain-containing protein [Calditrichaeota bacterium]|nr:MAG: DUF4338 domain-containing protein [Calditrichota bacterium]